MTTIRQSGRSLRVVQRHGETWVLDESLRREARPAGEANRLYEEARTCLRAHREAEAFELLQQVIWLDPENTEAMSWFGLCLAKLHGEQQQALEICTYALEHTPGNTEIRTNLGRVQRLSGDNASAHRSFLAAYRTAPADPGPATELARMGVRRPPVLRFLSRSHWCNRALGRVRYRWQQFLTAAKRGSA
jgi:Flp pilus assembly protein TadD